LVRGTSGQSYGQVTLTGPREMIVSAYRGELVVEYGEESHTIAEGKSYSVTVIEDEKETSDAQQPQGSGVKRAVKRHLLVKLILVGALAVGSYFLWQELCESTEKLEHCF
jgi:cytochrome c-type biogenesis protein CcmH/NrfG